MTERLEATTARLPKNSATTVRGLADRLYAQSASEHVSAATSWR